jgi:hypothetical protein
LQNDAAALFGHVAQLAAGGLLFPNAPAGGVALSQDTAISPLVLLGPTGSMAGWRMPIAVKAP